MNRDISNLDDVVDSRSIVERIAELEGELTDAHEGESEDNDDTKFPAWVEAMALNDDGLLQDAAQEYRDLTALVQEINDHASDNADDGVTLIRGSYFETYAQELANDIGVINVDATWPNNCINWERAARELQQDYTSIEWGGVTYWLR